MLLNKDQLRNLGVEFENDEVKLFDNCVYLTATIEGGIDFIRNHYYDGSRGGDIPVGTTIFLVFSLCNIIFLLCSCFL